MLRLKYIVLTLGLSFIPASSYACHGVKQLSYARFEQPQIVFEGRVESVSPLRFKVYNVVRGELDESDITVGKITGGGDWGLPSNYDSFVEKYGEIVRMGIDPGSGSCGTGCKFKYFVKAICAMPYILPVDSTRDDPEGDITQIYGQRGDYRKRLLVIQAELGQLFPYIASENLRNDLVVRERLLSKAMTLGNVKPPTDSQIYPAILRRNFSMSEVSRLTKNRNETHTKKVRYNSLGLGAYVEDILSAFEVPARERYLKQIQYSQPNSEQSTETQSQGEFIPPYTFKPSGDVLNGVGVVIGKVTANGEVVSHKGKLNGVGVVIGRVTGNGEIVSQKGKIIGRFQPQ